MKLLIDGDLIAFKIAASLETRSVQYKGKVFANVTKCKEWLSLKDEPFFIDELQRHVEYNEDELSELPERLNKRSEWWDKRFGHPKKIVVLGEGESFRTRLCKMNNYKGSRATQQRPVLLSKVRGIIANHFDSVLVNDGREGDDALVQIALRDRVGSIILSDDKDFFGCPTLNARVEGGLVVNGKQLGELDRQPSGVKGYGRKFFYFQLLYGDPVDEYRPFKHSKHLKLYGDVGVYKDLSPIKTDRECIDFVVEKYQKAYPEPITLPCGTIYTWRDALQEILHCAYMLRHEDDKGLSVDDFIKGEYARAWIND